MSDDTTATEPTSKPTGELSGPERTIALAKTALQAHKAERQQQARDKEARIAERITSVKALLLNVWDMLGIDPNTCTVDEHERPTWSGSLTLTDPDDPKAAQNTVTLETGVSLHQDGLYFKAGSGGATLYNKRGGGTLPDNPPSDEAIGNMVLSGWISALQSQERERQSTLDSLINSANIITNHYTGATEEALRKLAMRIAALKPGDLPDPYNKNLAKVNAALAKATQCVEARLKYEADYVAAATKVKLLAAKWQRRYAAWDDECSLLARSLTEHHFKPFTIYEIRYTAIGAPVVAVNEDGSTSMPTEAVHTMQSPLDIRNGDQGAMVNAIDYNGHPSVIVIGAFLDGYVKLDAKTPPSTSSSARFYHSRRIGQSDYYANFPPTVSKTTVDEIMDMLSFPLPPAPFYDTVLAELKIKIDDYNYLDASRWADIDPKELRKEILQLEQKPTPAHEEEDKDVEIPF
ncbi:MAG: hypothetical protein U0X20_12010 [Caldilineaceae bacterium]